VLVAQILLNLQKRQRRGLESSTERDRSMESILYELLVRLELERGLRSGEVAGRRKDQMGKASQAQERVYVTVILVSRRALTMSVGCVEIVEALAVAGPN
jgi:hypothetical protein